MSVRLENNAIHLTGTCGVEEAEALLSMLEGHPDAAVDLGGALELHTAVWQVLYMYKPILRGTPQSPSMADMILCAIKKGRALEGPRSIDNSADNYR